MKIIQLNAENIKRLVAVEIRPDRNLVEITGRNGQGKTSVLDAIWWALDGGKNIQSKPVRDGADSGSITLDLGEYKVVRKFKVKEDDTFTTSLAVTNADGFKASSPQEVLAKFIGDLTFDPLAFAEMKSRDQVVALRALVPDFDFDANAEANDRDFKERTEVNRTVRDLRAQVEAIVIPDDAPTERVSAADLMAELQRALDANSSVENNQRRRASLEEKIERSTGFIQTKRAEISRLQKEIEQIELEIEEYRDLAQDIPVDGQLIDTAEIQERIAQSENINRMVERREQRAALVDRLKEADAKSLALTKAMEERASAASAAVRAAKLPVPGLELTEEAILLNGQPFNQASDAEQLRVSIAVAGAMNPRLRVIRVRDGSRLDDEAMAALSAYADENDLQIWIERVDSSGQVGIVIEDGAVVEQHKEAAE